MLEARCVYDIFSGKVIRTVKVSDLKKLAIPNPYTYKLTLIVEKWMKGSGEKEQQVFDTAGADCDSLVGVNHIVMGREPLSTRWLVYITKQQGQLWVNTAEPIR